MNSRNVLIPAVLRFAVPDLSEGAALIQPVEIGLLTHPGAQQYEVIAPRTAGQRSRIDIMVGVLELLIEQRELFAALFDLTGEKRKIVLRRKPLREIGAQLKYIFRRWIERRAPLRSGA